jgi:hypothetical protein
VSPMMVERKCPTCISFAMFGLEKSTATLFHARRINEDGVLIGVECECVF